MSRRLPRPALLVCGLAAACGAPAPADASPAPHVTLAPAAGPPRSMTALRGAGFSPGASIAVRSGRRVLARAAAGPAGRFRIRLRIPPARGRRAFAFRIGPGLRLVTVFRVVSRAAVGSVSEVAVAGARLRWWPAGGPPGTRVHLAGGGLPGRVARVSFQGERTAVHVSKRGRLSTWLTARARPRAHGAVRSGRVSLPFRFDLRRPDPAGMQPRPPVRAAFYYPWFPGAWSQGGIEPFTRYRPLLGRYDSGSPAVIRNHLRALEYAGIEVAISSWWGRGDTTDTVLPRLLALTRATGSPIRWATYYEPEGSRSGKGPDPGVEELRADLEYIRDSHARDPVHFRIAGRFVVFVWGDSGDGCPTVSRWRRASQGLDAYLVLKVFTGYRSCPLQPDAWHEYAPAVAEDHQDGWSFSVSPGFDKATEASPRLGRDLGRWRESLRRMVASSEPFQLVTTFNEWGEGTAVEGAREWASPSGFGTYLDALHDQPPRK